MGDFLLIIWFGAVGAAIGSFLNVVIYRLPRGESLVSPPSHCPRCNHKIRMYDNFPIFGWFFLGGKCRDCKQPISFRYPLIETIACSMVMTFAALLMPMEQNFVRPDFATPETMEMLNMPLETDQRIALPMTFTQVVLRLIWLSALHLFLLALGMIEFDGQKLGIRGMTLFVTPFLIFGLFFPCLFPVAWFSIWPLESNLAAFSPQRVADFLAIPLFDMFFGGGMVVLLGFSATKIIRVKNIPMWLMAMVAIGTFLGWQSAIVTLLVALLLHATILFVTRHPCPILALAIASFFVNVWILAIAIK